MSQRAVERAVGKLVTDEGFRVAFYRDAAVASRDAGLELTPAELHALLHIPAEALGALAARLDDRICCVHIPLDTEEARS